MMASQRTITGNKSTHSISDMGYPEKLLRNDQDATKHMCLFYLAGLIGTGAALEDFFYLLCKTLDYDKNKVLFFYSTYMTITNGLLFSELPDGLTETNYGQWISTCKQRCTSTRTSTCANLCKRKSYKEYDIPSGACLMCKLSPSYQNSRDPLERIVIRYFMNPSTPISRIYINNVSAGSGFMSVERISPRANTFGKYPVIRFYHYIYDFLFSDPCAASLRSNPQAFNDAAVSYIYDHLDLVGYNEELVTQDMIFSKLHILLNSLWKTDMSEMMYEDDTEYIVSTCIQCLSEPYEPVFEGKQMNPHAVSNSTPTFRQKRSTKKTHDDSPDLFQLFEANRSALADSSNPSSSDRSAAEPSCKEENDDLLLDAIPLSESGNEDPISSKESTLMPTDEAGDVIDNSASDPALDSAESESTINPLSVVDMIDFSDADYTPFIHSFDDMSTDMPLGDPAALATNSEHEHDIAVMPDDTPAIDLTPLTSSHPHHESGYEIGQVMPYKLSYLGQLLPATPPPYQYCITIPRSCFQVGSGYTIIRVTDESNWDFLQACASSDYALLSPAVMQGGQEGLLIYLPSTTRHYFFNLSTRGGDSLDSILLNQYVQLYTSDTLGCINMLVKYGSDICGSALIGMDLYFMLRCNLSSRLQVYLHSGFAHGNHEPCGMSLAAYMAFKAAISDQNEVGSYLEQTNRLQTAYRVLLHQWYLPPILADAMPIATYADDLTVNFLFREGYRFVRSGTVYTILFHNDMHIGGDLSAGSFLVDVLGLFDSMTHRYYHTSRIIYCDDTSISIFIESSGADAAIFYDLFYHGLEICMGNHGYQITNTVTVRIEYL